MAAVDSHVHFWRYSAAAHSWMGAAHAPIKRDFLPDDLAPLLAAAGVGGGCVAVQASQSLAENDFLFGLAAQAGSPIRGVVGWADLRLEPAALRAQLAQLCASAPRRRLLVGVRHVVHDESDDVFVLGPEFRRGVALLAEFGLTYDLLLFPKHLRPARKLVAECPAVAFVLDHIAKPHIRATAAAGAGAQLEPAEWESDLRALAALPNVSCKVSGMVTEAQWGTFGESDFDGFLDVVFDAFGRDRVMLGSDWPVCILSANYQRTAGVAERYMARRGFSEAEVAAVRGGTCERVYRLLHRE